MKHLAQAIVIVALALLAGMSRRNPIYAVLCMIGAALLVNQLRKEP